MTKLGKNLSKRADRHRHGKRIGAVEASLNMLANRYRLTLEETITELEGLRRTGLCEFNRIPDNPHTKFKLEIFAHPPDASTDTHAVGSSSSFARWVETKYGQQRRQTEPESKSRKTKTRSKNNFTDF